MSFEQNKYDELKINILRNLHDVALEYPTIQISIDEDCSLNELNKKYSDVISRRIKCENEKKLLIEKIKKLSEDNPKIIQIYEKIEHESLEKLNERYNSYIQVIEDFKIKNLNIKIKSLHELNPEFYINYESLSSLSSSSLEKEYQKFKDEVEKKNKHKIIVKFRELKLKYPQFLINFDHNKSFDELENQYNEYLNVIKIYYSAKSLKNDNPELTDEQAFKFALDNDNLERIKIKNILLEKMNEFKNLSEDELVNIIIRDIENNNNMSTNILIRILRNEFSQEKIFSFSNEIGILDMNDESKKMLVFNILSMLIFILGMKGKKDDKFLFYRTIVDISNNDRFFNSNLRLITDF